MSVQLDSPNVDIVDDPAKIRKIKKASRGFLSYDWMVANILSHGSASDKKEEVPA